MIEMDAAVRTLVTAAVVNTVVIVVLAVVFSLSRRIIVPVDPPPFFNLPPLNVLRNPSFQKAFLTTDSEEGNVDDWTDGMMASDRKDIGTVSSGSTAASSVVAPRNAGQMAFLRAHGAYIQQSVTGLRVGSRYALKVTVRAVPTTANGEAFLSARLDGVQEIMPRQPLSKTEFSELGPFYFQATQGNHYVRLTLECRGGCPVPVLIAHVSLTTAN